MFESAQRILRRTACFLRGKAQCEQHQHVEDGIPAAVARSQNTKNLDVEFPDD